ncbi:hypothetical protein MKZ19_08720 [Shouchella clausii]|uniref:response regulator aspartate phosphatase n=1 Tax=Shouchella clausii TaxID=79880 RepID=UPI0031FCB2B2
MQILSSAEVGNLCVQWSNSIVARDANQAEVLKADVFSKLKFMEEDDKLIAYVQLIDLKHSLQFNQSDIEEKVEKIPSQVDSMLNFYRFYYLGRHEFYNGRYKAAYSMYIKAESELESCKNVCIYEKAEFFHYLAMAYYRIDQYTLATRYVEEAIEIFVKDNQYHERLLNCYLLLGGISIELNINEQGEMYYFKALKEADPYPATKGVILRAIGLLKLRQQRLIEAKKYFFEALSIPEHSDSVIGVKTKTNLASILYQLNDEKATELYHTALKEATRFNQAEYIIRLKILHISYNRLADASFRGTARYNCYFLHQLLIISDKRSCYVGYPLTVKLIMFI